MAKPLSRRSFLQSASLLATLGCALPWRGALAQQPGQPVQPGKDKKDKKKKKQKPLPQPGDDPKFDCGKYWIAELGHATGYSCTFPCLLVAEFKDYAGTLMEKEKIYVRWERIDPKTLRWIVLSAVCTHLRCKVDYSADAGHFICPCHKSEFDLDGEVLHKPARKPLPDYSELLLNEEGLLFLRREATRKSIPPKPEPEDPDETPR